jgi:hypothetical protein
MSALDRLRSILEWRRGMFGAGSFIGVKKLSDKLGVSIADLVTSLVVLRTEGLTEFHMEGKRKIWKIAEEKSTMISWEEAVRQARGFIRSRHLQEFDAGSIQDMPEMPFRKQVIRAALEAEQ